MIPSICNNSVMVEQAPKSKVLLEYAKQSYGHRRNRCDKCGRRLKLEPGAFINGTMSRFSTCRSCGFENPGLGEKVVKGLIEAGYAIPDPNAGVLDLPQCLNCGFELQVSRDFTKVFCSGCSREWDRYDFEDIIGGPLSAELAGAIPIRPDTSKLSNTLTQILDVNNIDSGSPYLVKEVFGNDSDMNLSTLKASWSAIKKGWDDGKKDDKSTDIGLKALQFIAIYEDCLTHYSWDGSQLRIDEVDYEDYFVDTDEKLRLPFNISFATHSALDETLALLQRFRIMHKANLSHYKPTLFGSASRDSADKLSNNPSSSSSLTLSEQLEKLVDLKEKGLLTADEFVAAKTKLLNT